MAVRQWRQSDWPVSPFLAIPDPATANQNRLANGCELRKHPSLTKIYCLDETLLAGFGYTLDQSGSGSRVKFEHGQYASIYMHKPHPSPVLKPYQIDVVIDTLRQEGLL